MLRTIVSWKYMQIDKLKNVSEKKEKDVYVKA